MDAEEAKVFQSEKSILLEMFRRNRPLIYTGWGGRWLVPASDLIGYDRDLGWNTRTVNRLVEKGLIVVFHESARTKRALLTEKGRAYIDTLAAQNEL